MSSMSKRAQARTERELHELLTQPGNSVCADCGTRNPGWASWSIGVFLCMRCAALHRKMGTHISKVKSLTMDTWTNEQVENMKKWGNNAVNKVYNPRNKKPDTPLDADEVDNAIERFIRKKYQEKSLSDGRPEVPSRDQLSQAQPRSPEPATSPTLPAKKKGFWTGFGLRASSSAYPLSKHDKKHRDEPKVDSAFRIASDDQTMTSTRKSSPQAEILEGDLKQKLAQLRDMGFTDVERNTQLLKKARGDVERVIAALIKLGPTEKEIRDKKRAEAKKNAEAAKATAVLSQSVATPSIPPQKPVPQPAAAAMNPFDALDQVSSPSGTTTSIQQSQLPQQQKQPQQPASIDTNPWQAALLTQSNIGLEQSFASMQVSSQQPLFPHNTGGYAMQQPTIYQSQAPPMPQYRSAASSPIISNNPFLQQTPLSAHSTGSNAFAVQAQSVPGFAPSTNPFLNNQFAPSQQSSSSLSNPFGLPPTRESQQQPQQSIFDAPTAAQGQSYFQQPQQVHHNQAYQLPTQTHLPAVSSTTSSPGFPNFQHGQPQNQISGYQQQPQQSLATSSTSYNPFQPSQHQFSPQPQSPQQPMVPQQTGRYDKASILAMYSYPQFAPQKPLASIPEPVEATLPQQPLSPAPSADIYSQGHSLVIGKRASTMPVTSTFPSSQSLPPSRNPFFNSPQSSATVYNTFYSAQSSPGLPQFSGAPQQIQSANPYFPSGGARHASADSMAVNNPNLMNGRHSPDVWGGLSART